MSRHSISAVRFVCDRCQASVDVDTTTSDGTIKNIREVLKPLNWVHFELSLPNPDKKGTLIDYDVEWCPNCLYALHNFMTGERD